MPLPKTSSTPSCRGECCRNPYGVCTHRRACAYHLPAGRPAPDLLTAVREASARRLLEREAGR